MGFGSGIQKKKYSGSRGQKLSFSNIAPSVVLKFETINRKFYKSLKNA
jgi:hypothetical protein